MTKLDEEFLRRAERITSFNIDTKDFETLCYKKEIQSLFKKHFFPKFDLNTTLNSIELNGLNRLIEELKKENTDMFHNLYSYNLRGTGPGEVMLYFLLNDAYLGGGSSSGADIIISKNKKYEVKCASISQDGFAMNFKLGGTVSLYEIMQELVDLASTYGLSSSKTEIPKSVVDKLRIEYPYDFDTIENKFRAATASYFSDHEVIFLNHNTSVTKRGRVEKIMKVKSEFVYIERLTSGTIKPKVRL